MRNFRKASGAATAISYSFSKAAFGIGIVYSFFVSSTTGCGFRFWPNFRKRFYYELEAQQ